MLPSSPSIKALYLLDSWLHVWPFCRACVNSYFLLIWTFFRCWYGRQDIIWTCCYPFKLGLKFIGKWHNFKKWYSAFFQKIMTIFNRYLICVSKKIVLTQLYHWSSLYEVRSSDLKYNLALSSYLFSFNNDYPMKKSSLIFSILFFLVLKAKIHNLFIYIKRFPLN